MNKKVITGLIVLMGISILGVITVQWIWMNHAIKVKNELFDRSVVEAMDYATGRIEKLRDVKVITNISLDDTLQANVPYIISNSSTPANTVRILPKRKSSQKTNVTMLISSNKKRKIEVDTSNNPDTISWNEEYDVDFNTDDIDEKIDQVFYTSVVKIDSLVDAFDDVDRIVPDMKKKVIFKATHLKNVANKVVTEIISSENEIPDTIKIKKILTEKLSEKNIPIPFHLGIIKDSVIIKSTLQADSTLLINSPYKASLFPNDIFDKNLSFAIYFPSKGEFIYKSISWLLFFSMILSSLVLATFGIGIFFILKQKKISEMKSDFINNMTHEFKTPIATISVAADSVLNKKVLSEPEKIRYFLGMIKKENSRMNRQVEDILTIARLDKKDFEFNWELVDIHELIEESIEGIELQIKTRNGIVNTVLNAGNPIVTCDKNHCSNVLYNLLDNAIKYTTGTPEITIETKNVINGVILSIQDNGIGMSKTVQNRVFEKFYRQTSGNIHNVKGFGLGLSYVKAVIEANKGNITVKSELGKGSRFDVFIPFIRE